MTDIIRLLPDSVANQIAAGEVIQRPASVVKELVENSIDAGASEIKVVVRDAGKTLIQVIDNGSGMTETDARMAFERHATSKINSADDLFSIRTMGFRGEALASIAAVAQVETKTRQPDDETGTFLEIHGSEVITQEPVACMAGTHISVKNLFYNIPARRRFLKTDSTELRHIITEFQRSALACPSVAFSLIHNQTEIYQLPEAPLRQRIAHIFGKGMNQHLIPLEAETSIVKISGFIGKPEVAKKTAGEQFFFVNHRFMRHAYFHKAVTEAFEPVLPADSLPSYFICFEILPDHIDVNIHPTKTEIKFEDERAVWQILHATVREALGKFNITPSLDFDREGVPEIPPLGRTQEIKPPQIDINTGYNPFSPPGTAPSRTERPPAGWESLYEGLSPHPSLHERAHAGEEPFSGEAESRGIQFYQFKNRYIFTPVKSGLMIIDQKRAHERILYETFLNNLEQSVQVSQKNLFPVTLELEAGDHTLLMEMHESLKRLGFEIRDLGHGNILVEGVPEYARHVDLKPFIEHLLESYKNTGRDTEAGPHEKIARSLAAASAIPYGKPLTQEEMQHLIDSLFACQSPNHTPGGKTIVFILPVHEIEKWFR
ncbi:MAG: DNA mismatch repair endonuclease MutL [Bacteroidales bacterium]